MFDKITSYEPTSSLVRSHRYWQLCHNYFCLTYTKIKIFRTAFQFGSSRCMRCPVNYTTRGLGSRTASACFFLDSGGSSLVDRRKGRKESLGLMFYNRWMTKAAMTSSSAASAFPATASSSSSFYG